MSRADNLTPAARKKAQSPEARKKAVETMRRRGTGPFRKRRGPKARVMRQVATLPMQPSEWKDLDRKLALRLIDAVMLILGG